MADVATRTTAKSGSARIHCGAPHLTDSPRSGGRLDDAQVPLRSVAERAQRLLVAKALMRGDGLLDAVESMTTVRSITPDSKTRAGCPRARKRPPDSRITGPASSTYAASFRGSLTERNVLIQ